LNYNDWYQCYNFLQYGNKLLVSRASNYGGAATQVSGAGVLADVDVVDDTADVVLDAGDGVLLLLVNGLL